MIFVHYGGAPGEALTGWLGVQIFFVLSGFLITTLLLRENEANGSIALGNFYLRRVFRIMPVYYVVFAIVVWQSFRLGGESWDQMVEAWPYYLTFLNEQTGPAPWKITWTLGIEWKFYMVWPAVAFFLVRTGKARLGVSAAIVAFLAAFWSTSWLNPYHYLVLMQGSILAILMNSRRGFQIFAPLTRPVISTLILLAFAVLQVYVGRLVPVLGDQLTNLYGLAVAMLIPAILGPGLPRRLLSSRPFVFVGQRSYSLYLLQILASQAVTGWAPWRVHGVAYAALTMAIGLVLSDFLLRYVERPMIAWGRKWESGSSRRRLRDPSSTAA